MARMHSRKRGQSASHKPIRKTKLTWVRYKKEEVEKLVIKLAKAGKNKSEIGIILRDSYGVPDTREITGKKIGKIIEEAKLNPELPEDLVALIKNEIMLMKHVEQNNRDKVAKRGLQLTTSKINRLAKYYKKTGKIPKDWQYSRDKAKMLIE
jgi:small subunit ribosomal protein S15